MTRLHSMSVDRKGIIKQRDDEEVKLIQNDGNSNKVVAIKPRFLHSIDKIV